MPPPLKKKLIFFAEIIIFMAKRLQIIKGHLKDQRQANLIVNLNHESVKLANKIDWKHFNEAFQEHILILVGNRYPLA